MGGGIDDRDGVARAVGDGIGDPEDLDATAFVVDASRHRAMDDCARAGLDRQVARNCAVEDETDAPMQRRIASDHAIEGDILLRSEEHTSELQSLMRISYAVFCLK